MWDHRRIYASNAHRFCALKRFMDLIKKSQEKMMMMKKKKKMMIGS
jgi:hypothetical protein